ncbi:MAG: FAD:protein FMN transferase [Eubacteriales bacterium]|nr:FAD:protein FMN transferase [Eubacteriales bacterium]
MKKRILALGLLVCLLLAGCTVDPIKEPSTTHSRLVTDVYVSIYTPDNTDDVVFSDAFEAAQFYAEDCYRQLERLNTEGFVTADDDFLALMTDILNAADAGSSPLRETLIALWFGVEGGSVPSDETLADAVQRFRAASVTIEDRTVRLRGEGCLVTINPMLEVRMLSRIRAVLLRHGITLARITVGSVTGTIGRFDVNVSVSYGENERVAGSAVLTDANVCSLSVFSRYFYTGETLCHGFIDVKTGRPAQNDLSGIHIFFTDNASALFLGYTALCLDSAADAARFLGDASVDAVILRRDGTMITVGGVGSSIPFQSSGGVG